jgi:carbonic anhydrase
MTFDEIIQRLKDGNRRFANDKSQSAHRSRDWRAQLVEGQHPIATILGCSDSRVPVELLFDQGFGDLFVIRLAGNIVDKHVVGSIEYAVKHLGTQVLLVLGHTRCGAVTAAVDTQTLNEPEEIEDLLTFVRRGTKEVDANLPLGERVSAGVVANVRFGVEALNRVSSLRESIQAHKLTVIGGVFQLETGRVDFLT